MDLNKRINTIGNLSCSYVYCMKCRRETPAREKTSISLRKANTCNLIDLPLNIDQTIQNEGLEDSFTSFYFFMERIYTSVTSKNSENT